MSDTAPRNAPLRNGTRWLSAIVGGLLFLAALSFVVRELRSLHWRDIEHAITATAPEAFGLAFLALLISLLAASTFDGLALAGMAARRAPGDPATPGWRQTAPTSVLAFILSNAGGFGMAMAGALRYRSYNPHGLKGPDVALISGAAAAIGLIGGFGLLSVGAAHHLARNIALAHVPHAVGLLAAFIGFKLILLYLAAPRVGPLTRFLPPHRVRLGQVVASSLEWMAAASVLYAFLPPETRGDWLNFLPVFATAGLLGAVSGLPGGIGPFDAAILAMLAPGLGGAEVAGALLLYRLVYILLPLLAVALVESLQLARAHRDVLKDTGRVGSELWLTLAPTLFGLLTFSAGVLMLVSAATPDALHRLKLLAQLVPTAVVELSHFLASLIGVALLFLGAALTGKMHRAYVLTLCFLLGAAVMTLAKGLNYEEAGFFLLIAGLIFLSRDAFYRQGTLRSGPLSPGSIAAIIVTLISVAGIGFFAYKHVDYSHDLWWTFVTDRDAPRFLRALVGAGALSLILFVWRFTNPVSATAEATPPQDMARAEAIWATANNASPDGNLAFLGDKSLLFSASGNSFIQYMPRGNTWVAMGEPVGKASETREMIWAFRDLCDRHGARPVFYAVRRESLPDFIDCGLVASKIGENAIVDLRDFSLNGPARAPFRHILNRGARDGLSFEIVASAAFHTICADLKAVSDSWLDFHKGSEKGFSLGRFDETYLARFPMAVVRKDGRIVGFSNLWTTPDGRLLSIDLMRYSAEAPRNVMDYLFVSIMLWGHDQGYEAFDLGMAPLAGLESRPLAPSLSHLGAFIFNRGEDLYGFQGLRAFKQKYDPDWRGSYIAAPTSWLLIPALADAALLSSGGLIGLVK